MGDLVEAARQDLGEDRPGQLGELFDLRHVGDGMIPGDDRNRDSGLGGSVPEPEVVGCVEEELRDSKSAPVPVWL